MHYLDAKPGLFETGAQIGGDMRGFCSGADEQHIGNARQRKKRGVICVALPGTRLFGCRSPRPWNTSPPMRKKPGP